MSRLEPGGRYMPSAEAVSIAKVTLKRLGFAVAEADAHSLVEAVLAVEGPRLRQQLRGAFENSLEIIRDTAEAALGAPTEKRVERSDLLGGGRRPVAPPYRPEEEEELDDGEPRPVFKRPRR